MSSAFSNRRKPRKIGGDEEDEADGGAAPEPVVKRPTKSKPKSKLRMSFNPGGTSMADEEEEPSEVVIPKRHGLGRKAMERNASQRNILPSGAAEQLSARFGHDLDRPSYSSDYLRELKDSTPSTPKSTDDESKAVDVAAKFGEVMVVSAPSAIPSEAEIREKKARRARLALEHGSKSTEEDFISLDTGALSDDDWDAIARGEKSAEDEKDTRLIRDDEDFAEGFDEYVEDGKISLGNQAEREQKRKQRDAMRELIENAEGPSDEEDSDVEEKAAYEAKQTKAAIGHKSDGIERPRTPPKMTSLPRLSNSLERLRMSLAAMETSKTQMIVRMEDLRKEKADIAVREVEIQTLIKEAGDNYERLKKEAGVDPSAKEDATAGALEKSRGLESIGASLQVSDSSDEE
ncbi:hypothetical protein N7493_006728 [Penicillium malachiteum]|uniref:Nineteen complex-related protein 2-domain-containing protein n=1 Tax=Penicillium malachiteum TaxID=1324776 RepID=A0AAD6HJ82_9EURO|nr:hypothetical protein N7493_006728 [Penicillium malachiteum]